MSGGRRWGVGAATALVAAGLALVVPVGAQAAPGDGLTTTWTGDTVNIAWDGTPYTTTSESFVGVPVTVPGDRAVRTLRVTNDGPTAGTVRAWIVDVDLADPTVAHTAFYDDLRLAWTTASSHAAASFSTLAATDRTEIGETHVGVGASTDLTIAYEFPTAATSGNRSVDGALQASFDVYLEITGDTGLGPTPPGGGEVDAEGDGSGKGGGSGALATTGAQVAATAGLALGVLVTGLLLVVVARRRRRHDEEQAGPGAPPQVTG